MKCDAAGGYRSRAEGVAHEYGIDLIHVRVPTRLVSKIRFGACPGILERVKVEAKSLTKDTPSEKPTRHDVPDALLADLGVDIIGVDLVKIVVFSNPGYDLPRHAEEVTVAQIMREHRTEDKATARVVHALWPLAGLVP